MKNVKQAFSEVSDILNHMERELYEKIPKGFINMIEENKDMLYNVNIDYSIDINKQDLLQDTRIILAIIYRDYICSKEKRQQLLENDNKELKMQEKILREKYEIDFEKIKNSRKKNNTLKDKQDSPQKQLIETKKESWFKRVFNKLLKFFKKR